MWPESESVPGGFTVLLRGSESNDRVGMRPDVLSFPVKYKLRRIEESEEGTDVWIGRRASGVELPHTLWIISEEA